MSLGLFWGRGFTDNRDQLQLVNTAFPSLGLLALRGFCDVLDTFPGLHGCGIFLTSLRVFRTGSQRPNVMLWHVLDVIDASVRQWSTVLLSSFKVSRWGPWPGSTFGKQPNTGRTWRWCPQLQRCPQWWDDRALVKNVGTHGSVERPCSLLWSRMVLPAVPPLCKDFLFLIWTVRLLSCNPGACLRPKQPGFYQFFQGWFSTLPNDCTSWLEVKTPSLLGAKHQSLQEIQVFKLKANPTWNDSGQTGKAEGSLSNSEEAWGFSLL